ncbi:MAG: CoA-binding protein [Bacteroidetes bacterium]|nr:MAG: CoA-binding protein [Bacteroidota bacterium]
MEKILVLGASPNPVRYSNRAVHSLKMANYLPVPLGVRDGEIAGIEILKGKPKLENIAGVTLYLNARRQSDYYDYILDLSPRFVIFNPGTENPEFVQTLKNSGIDPIMACNLTMLALDDMPKPMANNL